MKKKDVFDFNKGLNELENIVNKMESGDLTLDDSIKYFEKGIELSKKCQKALNEANERVVKLTKEDDYKNETSFDIDDK